MAKSHWTKAEPRGCPLIDLVCFYLDDAAQKVIKNKGAPGIDGITYEQLPNLLRVHGEKIRQKLKNGTYIPVPVRRVDIPKPNEGTRMLGIPRKLCKIRNFSQSPFGGFISEESDGNFPSGRN